MKSNNFYSKRLILFGCSLLFLSQATGMEYEIARIQQQEAAMARENQLNLEKIASKSYAPISMPGEKAHAPTQQISNRFISDALANIRARTITSDEFLQARLIQARNQLMTIQAIAYSAANEAKSAATNATISFNKQSLKVIEEIYASARQEAEKVQQAYTQAERIIQNNSIFSSRLDPILDEISILKQSTLDVVSQIANIITKLKAKQTPHAVTSVIKTLAPKPEPIEVPTDMLSQGAQLQTPH